jgi:hypothetical protein
MAPGSQTQKMPLGMRRSFGRGAPCGWFGSVGHLDMDSVRVGGAYQFGGQVVARY